MGQGAALKIIHARPPNFEAIAIALPAANQPGVIFCFGHCLYNPAGRAISPWIMAHEEVHCRQQNGDPDAWWERYIYNVEFRFAEELEAHRAEWRAWLSAGQRNRVQRRGYMAILGSRLAGPLYGRLVIFARAKELILEETVLEDA